MAFVDWAIVAGYVVVAFVIGLVFARKAARGTEEFFIAGRSLPWWIAGTSMVATSFASDTPIFISAMVREQGIYANWLWWSWIIGIMGATFFFAPLWRRSRAVTEIEFLQHRYDATKTMAGLRIFKATYDGIFVNCVVMATVTLAMSKLLAVILGIPADHATALPMVGEAPTIALLLAGLGLVAVGYTVLSGLYGVVYTDLIQFALAMVGAIALAVIVLTDVSETGGLAAGIEAAGADMSTLRLFPEFGMNLETASFFILLTVGWWIHTPGSGYLVQRMLATRSEGDALLSFYWFAFCHFVLRSWPWIIVGVASVIYFPTLVDPELSYPQMIDHLMPVGLKGIMVASILAAFMSTLDTHMNWGSSYVVNDIYRPYIVRDRDPHHYVAAARVSMLLLALVAVLLATVLSGVFAAVKYIVVLVGGIAFPLIVRWYWWRVTVWTEISAMICSLIVGNALLLLMPDQPGEDWFAVRLLINTLAGAATAVVVTLLTSRGGPTPQAIAFYERMRIAGPGWEKVRRMRGLEEAPWSWRASVTCCGASIALLTSLLLGTGWLIFGDWPMFAAMLAVAVISIALIRKSLPEVLEQGRRFGEREDAERSSTASCQFVTHSGSRSA